MADTADFYKESFVTAYNQEVDLQGGNVKCSLHTSAYARDLDTDKYWDVDVTNEIVDGAYTAGGDTVAAPTVAVVGVSFVFDGGDVAWPGNATAARYAVIYDDAPVSNKPLICSVDFGEDKVVLNITWNAGGIAQVTFA